MRYGGKVLGICGGFQMLGKVLADPLGLEGPAGSVAGLGLLDMQTELRAAKQLTNVTGVLALEQASVSGYEIHAGISQGRALAQPLVYLHGGGMDGALSEDGQVAGTYLHGFFEQSATQQAVLRWAGLARAEGMDYAALRERDLERLADLVEAHLDTAQLRLLCGINDA